jgi:hypothetical protein
MLITSHLLATLILSQALSLSNSEIFPAIIGGVAIDLDHLFINNKWKQDTKNFLTVKKLDTGINQHSWLQELVFGGFVGIVAGLIISYFFSSIRFWVFPVFILLHIFLDALMKFDHWPLVPLNNFKYQGFINAGTKHEIILSPLLLLLYVVVRHII